MHAGVEVLFVSKPVLDKLKYVYILLSMEKIDFAATCACFNIRKAARAVTSVYDKALRPLGIRSTQLTLLMALASAGTATITRLADRLVMDRTTLARDLKPLEAQGLVVIAAGQDRRVRVVELTEAGRATLDSALPLWHAVQQRIITNGLGATGWATLYSTLQDVVQLAQQEI